MTERKRISAGLAFSDRHAKDSGRRIDTSARSRNWARAGGRARFAELTMAAPIPAETSDRMAASVDTSDGGVGIPIIWGTDAVHGHSNIIGATIFPHNIGLGAMHDPALIEQIGAATAVEIRVTGQEWTFAPTVTVPQDFRWGRAYEGYSSGPALVSSYVGAMVRGLQGPPDGGNILASYVHHNDKTSANKDASQFGLGYNYPLSKRTSVYTAFAKINNQHGATFTVGNATEAGTGNKAFNLGVVHNF